MNDPFSGALIVAGVVSLVVLLVSLWMLFHVPSYPRVETKQVCKYVTHMWKEPDGRYMIDAALDSCTRVKWEGNA